MIGDSVSERSYHIFSLTTTISSCVFNAVLIYVIIFNHVKHIGPYRWLLMLFSLVDMCISLIHTVTIPKGHSTEFGFICIPLRFLQMPKSYGFLSMVCWCFLVYQTFILLAFHFVYRFVVLCDASWLSWMKRNPARNWISIGVLIDLLYTGSVVFVSIVWLGPSDQSRRVFAPIIKEAYQIDLNADNQPGFLAMTYWIPLDKGGREWQVDSIRAMVLVASIVLASVTVIVFCISRITRAMSETTWGHLESKTRAMQHQLFRALLWQTLIPTVTSYTPLALLMLIPLLSPVPLGGWATVFLSSMQLFPMIDPFLIMFFVPSYRPVLPKCLRSNGIVPNISFTTSTENSHQ